MVLPLLSVRDSIASLPEKKTCFYGNKICFYAKDTQDSLDGYLQIDCPEETTVAFGATFTNLEGPFKPLNKAFKGTHLVSLFHLKKPNRELCKPNCRWNYKWGLTYHIGTATRQHDEDAVYALPYEVDQEYRLIQGEHGRHSHYGPLAYAYDWGMPEGTKIYAARSGTVIETFDNSNVNGSGPSNHIFIEHSDGTVGQYLHLKHKGCLVNVGQKINQGDLIGLSGNTGKSTTPHLHFHVSTPLSNSPYAFKTFPLKFKTCEGVEELKQGRWYKRCSSPSLSLQS